MKVLGRTVLSYETVKSKSIHYPFSLQMPMKH